MSIVCLFYVNFGFGIGDGTNTFLLTLAKFTINLILVEVLFFISNSLVLIFVAEPNITAAFTFRK